jgi:hypothetical protein
MANEVTERETTMGRQQRRTTRGSMRKTKGATSQQSSRAKAKAKREVIARETLSKNAPNILMKTLDIMGLEMVADGRGDLRIVLRSDATPEQESNWNGVRKTVLERFGIRVSVD